VRDTHAEIIKWIGHKYHTREHILDLFDIKPESVFVDVYAGPCNLSIEAIKRGASSAIAFEGNVLLVNLLTCIKKAPRAIHECYSKVKTVTIKGKQELEEATFDKALVMVNNYMQKTYYSEDEVSDHDILVAALTIHIVNSMATKLISFNSVTKRIKQLRDFNGLVERDLKFFMARSEELQRVTIRHFVVSDKESMSDVFKIAANVMKKKVVSIAIDVPYNQYNNVKLCQVPPHEGFTVTDLKNWVETVKELSGIELDKVLLINRPETDFLPLLYLKNSGLQNIGFTYGPRKGDVANNIDVWQLK
jgi:hypothetical protein